MLVREQDQRPVAVAVAADPPRRLDQPLDFVWSQMLAGPPRRVRDPSGRGNFPGHGAWLRSSAEV